MNNKNEEFITTNDTKNEELKVEIGMKLVLGIN